MNNYVDVAAGYVWLKSKYVFGLMVTALKA